MPGRTLSLAVLEKVREQVDRLQHLVGMLPADKLEWRPDANAPSFTVAELLGHLLECLAGMCAALHAANPDRLAHFLGLRQLPVDRAGSVSEARERISSYLAHIEQGFAVLDDEQLAARRPTVFVPEGEPVLTLLLGNLEHLINHKHQLFGYLKLLGVPVGTPDLYRLRGIAPPARGSD